MEIDKLLRPHIGKIKAYSSARDEYKDSDGVFLDANENPYGIYNRYPDPYQAKLKARLSEIKQFPAEQIFIGNGSDELIDLCLRLFCEPQEDFALTSSPSYGMYEVSAAINNVDLKRIPLLWNFKLDLDAFAQEMARPNLKLIFLCSPNNPTGKTLSREELLFILERFKGIVFLDEAYIDFSQSPSAKDLIEQYPNLIISQTLSKAWGLASLRLGIALANSGIVRLLNRIKPPYNVSGINQETALKVLSNEETFQNQLKSILKEKELMQNELRKIDLVRHVYDSDANFLLVEVKNADWVYSQLVRQKIIVRNRNQEIKNCLRFSIGTPDENDRLLQALKMIS